MPTAPRISITMALDALEEDADEVRRIKALYDEALQRRDENIRDMRANRVPVATIMSRTSLSYDSIMRIVHVKPKGV